MRQRETTESLSAEMFTVMSLFHDELIARRVNKKSKTVAIKPCPDLIFFCLQLKHQ